MFVKVPTIAAMEEALAELRDLEWRAPSGGRSLGTSPWAKDGPWFLAQQSGEDVAPGLAEYSETLITNAAGKELLVRKVTSRFPRVPLRAAEVARLEKLRGWLELLPDALDRAIVWEASFHLWRGEPFDWVRVKARSGYPGSRQKVALRYHRAVAKLVCLVNEVPVRHHVGLLAREGRAGVGVLPR